MKTIIKKYSIEVVQETSKKYDEELRIIRDSNTAVKAFKEIFRIDKQAEEVLALLCFDTKNKIIGAFEVSRGTINSSMAHPREVYKRALLMNSVKIMLCHNHPSGEIEPSSADHAMTKRMKEASEIIGIDLLDHFIIGNSENNNFYSYRAETELLN